MVERISEWRVALMQFLGEAARKPLSFGQHDCAIFAAGAVQAMTGEDFAEPFRGRYSTLADGLRLLKVAGHGDHVALARSCLPSIPVAEAMPGDLAVCDGDGVPALGVVQGAAVYVLQAQGGLGLIPLTSAIEAFRV